MHITKMDLEMEAVETLPDREIPFVFSVASIIGSFNTNAAAGLNIGTVGSANFVSANQLIFVG